MDIFEMGDPYIEWNEEISARETPVMDHVETLETLKDAVVKLLMSEHDFSVEEAEEAVAESLKHHEDMWNENAEAKDLANFLASDESDV